MFARSDHDAAITSYRKALELSPDAIGALDNLVDTLIQSDQVDEAIAELKKYLDEHPNTVKAKFLLGTAYARLGNLDAAAQQFEQVIDSSPQIAQAYINLAKIYEVGSEARVDALERGIAAIPNNAMLGLYLSIEYVQGERYEDAINLLEVMQAANPSNDIFANNLAALLLDYRTDEASYQRAMELTQNFSGTRSPVYADTLGWAYYRNGEYQNAVRYLEISVSGAGQVALYRYHLGMAYFASGDSVGARIELNKSLELAGDDVFKGITEARETLDGLNK